MKLPALTALVFAVAWAPVTAFAQAGRAACAGEDANLPAEYTGWKLKSALTSAAKPADFAMAPLLVGKAVAGRLHPSDQVAYAAAPEKADGPPGYGGMFGLTINRPGTYAIALGGSAWVDVLKTGKPLDSTAHGHGPDCSSIGKVVAFKLQPGRYVVQVVANPTPSLAIMAAAIGTG